MVAPFSLDVIQVASPCRAAWDGMTGDDRVRHCGECQKNVYNLSEMSRAEADALIREHEGHLCVRFYRRKDGTMLTADCPVGVRAVVARKLVACIAGALALVGLGLYQVGLGGLLTSRHTPTQGTPMPRLWPLNPAPTRGMVMGEVVCPPPAIQVPPNPPVATPDVELENEANPGLR
jgi:hypothetical protein